jgi:hypothetical protein
MRGEVRGEHAGLFVPLREGLPKVTLLRIAANSIGSSAHLNWDA